MIVGRRQLLLTRVTFMVAPAARARGFDPAEHEYIRSGKAGSAFLDYDRASNDADGEAR